MFAINDDMFGLYARIPTGFSNEPHYYKIVSRLSSNGYCDLPLGTCNTKQTRHGEIVPVLLVIHCGIDESEVIRVKEGDCEIVNSRLSELAEADRDGRCVVLPCKVGETFYTVEQQWTLCHLDNFRDEYSCQGCEEEECDSKKVPEAVAHKCSTVSQLAAYIGKAVFLTRPEAEAALASVKQVEASAVASEAAMKGGGE